MVSSRPGPKPQCTDTEILVLSLLRLLSYYTQMFGKTLSLMDTANHPDWFPHYPENGHFNRRARSLCPLLNAFLRYLTIQVGVHSIMVESKTGHLRENLVSCTAP